MLKQPKFNFNAFRTRRVFLPGLGLPPPSLPPKKSFLHFILFFLVGGGGGKERRGLGWERHRGVFIWVAMSLHIDIFMPPYIYIHTYICRYIHPSEV